MSEYYFFRHGETHANVAQVYNPLNDSLTLKGKKQVHAAREWVHEQDFDVIFVSPLLRTQETANLLDVTGVTELALAERDFGKFSGQPRGKIKEECEHENIAYEDFIPPNGESYAEWENRVQKFLESLPEGKYLFISHDGTIRHGVEFLTKKSFTENQLNASMVVVKGSTLVHSRYQPWLNQ